MRHCACKMRHSYRARARDIDGRELTTARGHRALHQFPTEIMLFPPLLYFTLQYPRLRPQNCRLYTYVCVVRPVKLRPSSSVPVAVPVKEPSAFAAQVRVRATPWYVPSSWSE